ncbi:MAG: hypothetical protein JSR67_12870 [Proteobacteria bacterium]|nr:hypothetical protein [Pseudomonadota bacterium]
MTRQELERALLDPTGSFGAPQDVVRSTELSRAQKLEVLCLWAYDARELAVAEEEGMPGGSGADDLDAVAAALTSLVSELDGEHAAPTKHAAACLRPRRPDPRSTG